MTRKRKLYNLKLGFALGEIPEKYRGIFEQKGHFLPKSPPKTHNLYIVEMAEEKSKNAYFFED